MKLFVTGHRPDKLGGYGSSNLMLAVRAAMRDKLIELKPEVVITGMALGVDQLAAQLCVDLRIPFWAYLPCEGQDRLWLPESRTQYQYLLGLASRIVLVTPGPYEPWKMQARNMRMVDDGDEGLGVFDGSKGGTYNCITYAKSRAKPLHIINPKLLGRDCQSGDALVCRAGARDGIICPEDSCDIDDKVR